MTFKFQEEWRVEQEDALLEKLYKSPLVDSKPLPRPFRNYFALRDEFGLVENSDEDALYAASLDIEIEQYNKASRRLRKKIAKRDPKLLRAIDSHDTVNVNHRALSSRGNDDTDTNDHGSENGSCKRPDTASSALDPTQLLFAQLQTIRRTISDLEGSKAHLQARKLIKEWRNNQAYFHVNYNNQNQNHHQNRFQLRDQTQIHRNPYLNLLNRVEQSRSDFQRLFTSTVRFHNNNNTADNDRHRAQHHNHDNNANTPGSHPHENNNNYHPDRPTQRTRKPLDISTVFVSKLLSIRQHHSASAIQRCVRSWRTRRAVGSMIKQKERIRREQARMHTKRCTERGLRMLQAFIHRDTIVHRAHQRLFQQKLRERAKRHAVRRIERWYTWRKMWRKAYVHWQAREGNSEYTNGHYKCIKHLTKSAHHHDHIHVSHHTRNHDGSDSTASFGRRQMIYVCSHPKHHHQHRIIHALTHTRAQTHMAPIHTAVEIIQRAWRRKLASNRVRWKCFFAGLRLRRQHTRAFNEQRRHHLSVLQDEERLVLTSLYVGEETKKVESEISKEKNRFEETWIKWQKKALDYFLKQKKLADQWILQRDPGESSTYYFNVDTGRSQHEHPHLKLFKMKRKKEKARATEIIKDRLKLLNQYRDKLRDGELASRQALVQGIYQKYMVGGHRKVK